MTHPTVQKVWFYRIGDQVKGPLSIQALQQLYDQDQIPAETPIWTEGAEAIPLIQALKQHSVDLYALFDLFQSSKKKKPSHYPPSAQTLQDDKTPVSWNKFIKPIAYISLVIAILYPFYQVILILIRPSQEMAKTENTVLKASSDDTAKNQLPPPSTAAETIGNNSLPTNPTPILYKSANNEATSPVKNNKDALIQKNNMMLKNFQNSTRLQNLSAERMNRDYRDNTEANNNRDPRSDEDQRRQDDPRINAYNLDSGNNNAQDIAHETDMDAGLEPERLPASEKPRRKRQITRIQDDSDMLNQAIDGPIPVQAHDDGFSDPNHNPTH